MQSRGRFFLAGLGLVLVWSVVSAWDAPVSGYEFLSDETQAMQDDEFANPGMFAVDTGRQLFNRPGFNGKSCASCHGADGQKLDPRRIARYPVYSAERERPVTLQTRINICREKHQEELPLLYDHEELVMLETFVRYLARGEQVNVDTGGPMRTHYEAGKRLYETRIGQLQMSCRHCHDLYQGRRLRDQTLSQGQVNGFPIYRLTTGSISSLHRKFRDCFATLRAIPYQVGSKELIDLEVYVTARGNGLPIETPGVRH